MSFHFSSSRSISRSDIVWHDRVIDKVTSIFCAVGSISDRHVKAGAEPVVRDSEEFVVEESIVHGAHSESE